VECTPFGEPWDLDVDDLFRSATRQALVSVELTLDGVDAS
jgi:hypothetical protein